MQAKFKSVIYTAVGIIVVFSLLVAVIPNVQVASANITSLANVPTLIKTMAGLWWIPMALILIAIVTSSVGTGSRRRRR